MSTVTNMILATMVDDASSFREDEGPLATLVHPGFVQVDQHAGGNKAMECDVFMAAVNGLDLDEVLEKLRKVPWAFPEEVQLFVKEQDDENFRVYAL